MLSGASRIFSLKADALALSFPSILGLLLNSAYCCYNVGEPKIGIMYNLCVRHIREGVCERGKGDD